MVRPRISFKKLASQHVLTPYNIFFARVYSIYELAQGRYRNQYRKCRFELTDPAICSRARDYGPTDLGEKGIQSFFKTHVCNKVYCGVVCCLFACFAVVVILLSRRSLTLLPLLLHLLLPLLILVLSSSFLTSSTVITSGPGGGRNPGKSSHGS